MAGTASRALTGTLGAKPPAVSQYSLVAYASDRIAAARATHRDRLLRRDFRMAQLELTVWFASQALARLCESTFAQQNQQATAQCKAEVFAMDAQTDGWEYPALWEEGAGFSSREFDRILGADGKRGFYHHDAPSWQFFDPSESIGVKTLPARLGMPPWETGSPLRLFLHWAYAAAGMRLTHAATLGSNGCGALIVGASGSGKSGTTLAGLLNGLTSVGDDYVAVERRGSVIAHSVFKRFKQDQAGLARAGLTSGDLPEAVLNWHGKVEFDATRLRPGGFVDRLEIRAILIPEIARLGRTEIEPVPSGQAALALAPSAVFQLPGDAEDGFRFFVDLARRLPAYRVRLSQNPTEIADTIGSFIEKEGSRSR